MAHRHPRLAAYKSNSTIAQGTSALALMEEKVPIEVSLGRHSAPSFSKEQRTESCLSNFRVQLIGLPAVIPSAVYESAL